MELFFDSMKTLLFFVLHQVTATLGAIVLAGISAYILFGTLRAIGLQVPQASSVLVGLPGFPLQVLAALSLGYAVERRCSQAKLMLAVSVLPAVMFLIIFLHGPLHETEHQVSRWSYYFGFGCSVANHCFDQFITTLPMLTAAGYAVGAMLPKPRIDKAGTDGTFPGFDSP